MSDDRKRAKKWLDANWRLIIKTEVADEELVAQLLTDAIRYALVKELEWREQVVCTHGCFQRGFEEHVPNCKSTNLRVRLLNLLERGGA